MRTGTERSDQTRLATLVAGTRFAQVEWVESTGSTNRDLLVAAESGVGEQVLIADFQSAGRGRRDRDWIAPPGTGLLMSVLIRPGLASGRDRHVEPFWVVGALAVAAAEAIDGLIGADRCGIKWPNDLEVDGAKLAGILAQAHGLATGASTGDHPGPAAIVVGIGINANWRDADPQVGDRRAIALNRLTGADIDRVELAAAVLVGLDRWLAERPERTAGRWKKACSTLGTRVQITMGQGSEYQAHEGTAVDVAADGSLVVDRGAAEGLVNYHVGDITHLRPAL